MCASHRRVREEKRRRKLELHGVTGDGGKAKPYRGSKYQDPYWATPVFHTELGIYQTIQVSEKQLTNRDVKAAITELIRELNTGESPLPANDVPTASFNPGDPVPFLMARIRDNWKALFDAWGQVDREDLIGILRTLLNSIEAHAAHSDPERGYVAFLDGFLRDAATEYG